MPALLSSPQRHHPRPDSAPFAGLGDVVERHDVEYDVGTEAPGADAPQPRSPLDDPRARRWAGLLCLALALVLAGTWLAPLAAVTLDLAQIGRASVLATTSDLAHRVLPSQVGTASTDGAGTAGAPGKTGACAPGGRDALGESLVIDQESWICGDVSVYAANLTVLGRVDGSVRAIGGSVLIAGQVSGAVTSVGGNVDLQPGAQVGGDVQSIGGTVNKSADTLIRGNVSTGSDALQSYGPGRALDPYAADIPWVQLLFWGLAAAALSLLFPQYVLRVRVMAQRQLAASFVSGVLALLLAVIATLVLVVTLIGIPLALVLLAALWVAWVIGNVSLGSWLGGSLMQVVSRERRSVVLSTVLGAMLLAAVETLPYVGWPIFALAGLLGLGAVVRAYVANRRSKRMMRRGE